MSRPARQGRPARDDRPVRTPGGGPLATTRVLLFPGAGSDRSHAALVAVDDALSAVGAAVERVDFPYRRAGRRAPDRAPVLCAAIAEAVAGSAGSGASDRPRLVLGGRSMGGRMCSLATADARVRPDALVLIAFPLHPPGKPERAAERMAHLARIDVPCLFVHGTRDPFASPDELRAATATIPGAVTHHWVEGGRHDLAGADAAVAAVVRDWLVGGF